MYLFNLEEFKKIRKVRTSVCCPQCGSATGACSLNEYIDGLGAPEDYINEYRLSCTHCGYRTETSLGGSKCPPCPYCGLPEHYHKGEYADFHE